MFDKNMSFKDYLKKFTNINNKFVNDFFDLYDKDTTSDDFVINLDNIAKWLKTIKKVLKTTLKDSYQINIDYTVETLKPKGPGRPEEKIMLTPSCFKRLCMMSRAKKAEEVREYFLSIEDHLSRYKSYIIEGLNKIVNNQSRELKPSDNVDYNSGVIYVLKTNEDIDDVYKIGRTLNFKQRLSTHQSSHPEKLEIAYVYETDNINEVENCLKQALKNKVYRKRREFYEIEPTLLKAFIKACDCISLANKKGSKYIKNSDCKYILHITKNDKHKDNFEK